jgi:hypothetical protein
MTACIGSASPVRHVLRKAAGFIVALLRCAGCAASALVFGLITLSTKKSLIIVITSICGAFGFTFAFDQLFLARCACGPFAATPAPVPMLSINTRCFGRPLTQ